MRAFLLFACLLANTSLAIDIAEEEDPHCALQLLQEKLEHISAKEATSQSHHERSEAARTEKVWTAGGKLSFRAVVAEFIAMTLFVFFGCGSAMSIAKERDSAWVLQVSLSFGIAITVLAYTIGHYSGAQINCAVTLGLVLYGHVGVLQGFLNFLAQMVGSVLGAFLLKAMYPSGRDCTGGLGTNSIAPGWTQLGALIGEFMGTFLLMYVVFETAVNGMSAPNSNMAPLAIGFSVFLAHSMLIPVDGCSINPTRTIGPALVESFSGGGGIAFKDMWVFWVGPLAGAAVAAAIFSAMA